jgi:hypothetical protein
MIFGCNKRLYCGTFRAADIRVGLLLTKCDEACEQVKADLTRVMRRRPILKAAQEAEEKLGINLNSVFVIKVTRREISLRLRSSFPQFHAITSVKSSSSR